MASLQDTLDNIAQVVGGSPPDLANRPRLFSGDQVGDSTGVVSSYNAVRIKGAYSAPPQGNLPDCPWAVVMLDTSALPTLLTQGAEQINTTVLVQVCVPLTDLETQYPILMGYHDTYLSAFRAKMTAFASAGVLDVYPSSVKWVGVVWGQTEYRALEFRHLLRRYVAVTYQA